MARRRTDTSDSSEPAGPQECMPCGGRGTLVSKLGGQESSVPCPWCEGSGQRRPGIDAQAHWAGGQPEAEPDAGAAVTDS